MDRNRQGSVGLKVLVVVSLLGLTVGQVALALHRASVHAPVRPLPALPSSSADVSPSAPPSRESTVTVRLPAPARQFTAATGSVIIVLENGGSEKAGLRLEGLAATIEPIAPGTSSRVTATLGPGTYTLSVIHPGTPPIPVRLVIH